eukprot:augustus_masked-scaffold_110-processed-gene-0.2-mRNA-1 protein AED:1.00 eAED:1.00 QI:0/0/0/0/1/1/2/0/172
MEKVNKNRSEPPVLRSESGGKSGGRVVAEISSRNIITRDTETPQELNQVAVEENSSQGDMRDTSEAYRSVSDPGENITTPDHVGDSNSESSDLSASFLSSAESEDDVGDNRGLRESERKRAREEKYKGKPILRSLEPGKVASFLEEFEVYETNVVRGRLKLPNADISLSLSN